MTGDKTGNAEVIEKMYKHDGPAGVQVCGNSVRIAV
jgi:hypothetical protein